MEEPPLSKLASSRRNAVSASVMSEEDAISYVKKVTKSTIAHLSISCTHTMTSI